jgi:inner membrane protein
MSRFSLSLRSITKHQQPITINQQLKKMLAPNHLIGGFVFTGIFAALAGQNILETPTNLACTLICTQLCDIDHLRSPISYLCRPLSRYISRRFGHRTITHSVFALVFVVAVAWIVGLNTWICGLSFFSHILLDAMTKEGVRFFYPISPHKRLVISENPKLRFSTNDYRSEIMLFGIFSALSVFTFPLTKNGFWTTYNNSFGTLKTLHSEFIKSKDLLEVDYIYQIGSEIIKGKGYCIESQEKVSTLYSNNGKWLELNDKDMVIKDLKFTHTKKPFKIDTYTFIAIPIDSLNALIASEKIVEIEVQCNQTAKMTEGGITKDFRTFKKAFPYPLSFSVKDTAIFERPFFSLPSVSAKLKRHQIQSVKDEYEAKLKKWENTQIELKNLVSDTSSNLVQRERNLKRIVELRGEKAPELDIYRIQNLEFEALISEQQDALQTQIEYQKYLLEQAERKAKIQTPSFSGYVKVLFF